MATQLSIRPPSQDTRASQLLPSITCSTCAQPIALDGLADHICPGPPSEKSSSIASTSPTSRSPPPAAATLSSNNYTSPLALKRLAPSPLSSSIPRSSSPLRPNNNPNSPPSTRPSFDQQRPSFDQSQARPSFDSQRPPQPPRSPFQERQQPQQQQQQQQQMPQAPAPDTKTGGEAGMAGVGRRAFAAAAAAAMFTVAHPQPHRRFVDAKHPVLNVPDQNSPPRAPSPYSSHGHGSNHGHGSDHGHQQQQQPLSVMGVDPRQRRPSAAERPRLDTSPVRNNDVPIPDPRSQLSPDDFAKSPPKLAYLDSTVSSKTFSPPKGKRSNQGHNDEDSDEDEDAPKGASRLGNGTALDGALPSRDAVDFPKSKSKRRSSITESFYSTASRDNPKAGASLERSLSSPFDSSLSQSTNPTSAGSSSDHHLKAPHLQHPARSNTSPSLSNVPKDQPTTRRRSEKKCVKCGKKITDGKWIQVDSTDSGPSTVLCEYDWKMLYLPKCRRCDKPIEGQAIGSVDGQIKGKYHRGCFNCTNCQKPFPDKSFYVFDGKPFCEYHYHEANNSLCASPRCGLPIEGACAVAHSGDRYHPEHFICEQSTCKERLHDEYWEIDGTRLCDRHARSHPMFEEVNSVGGGDDDDDDEHGNEARDSLASTSTYDPAHASFGRAQKRMTRYVDL